MEEPAEQKSPKVRILLIDDQKVTETMVGRMVDDDPDLMLYYCQNPLEAISMAETIRPVVVLMDLVMPEIDGITLMRRFRNRRAFSQLPIVMLSTEQDPQIKSQAFAAGASDYLVKLPGKVEMLARLHHYAQDFFEKSRKPTEKEVCSDIINSDLKGFWIMDGQTNTIFDVNDALCGMLGISRESVIGKTPYDFVDEENYVYMKKAMDWIPKGDKRIHEIHLNTFMSGQIYSRFCVTISLDTMDRKIVAVFTFLNIHKLNKEYFDILKNEFRFIADSVPGLLWLSNPNNERIFFNKSWLSFRGVILEQELRNGWLDGIHPEDVQQYKAYLDEAFLQKRPHSLEFRLRNGSGEYRWVYETALPRFTSSGFFMGFSGSCVDITDRKIVEGKINQVNYVLEQQVRQRTIELQDEVKERQQAEVKERRANQAQQVVSSLLRIALEIAAPLSRQLQRALEVIFAVSWLSVQKRGCIFLADCAAQELLLSASVGLTASVASQCARVPYGQCLCGRVAATGKVLVTIAEDNCAVFSASDTVPHGHCCLPIISGTKMLGVLNLYVGEDHPLDPFEIEFLQTISHALATLIEHHHIDQLRDAKRKADGENRAKSEFLATMSHEIRTPMNAIVGMTELLRAEEISPQVRYYADTIMHAGESLLAIINDILDYSKIAAGKLTLEQRDFDLPQLLRTLTTMFDRPVQEKNLVFRVETDPNLPQFVCGDSVRIWQIIVNLLSNAIKFTQTGEVVLLADVFPTAEVLRLQVRDTGIGISPEVFSRLFRSFEQGDKSITRRYGGTGLGLAITQMLVDLMEGQIEVESTPGKGTLFRVSLPLVLAKKNVQAETCLAGETANPWSKDARLLVAEDDPINRAVVLGMLKKLGIKADMAENGKIALEKLQINTYDLVFMDCQMPEMDGYSVCRAFRVIESSLAKVSRTPIVALTAFSMQGDREKCLEAGMDDYMSKPVRGADFKIMLGRWLNKSQCNNGCG